MAQLPDPPSAGDEVLVLVPERRSVRAGAREVRMTPTQFRLLSTLLAEPGRIFSRAELMHTAIGTRVTERTVDVHVKDLRRKLGPPYRAQIKTVRGRGYCFRGQRSH